MNKRRGLLFIVLLVGLCAAMAALAADEAVLDIENGELFVDMYRLELADTPNPVTISEEDGHIVLHVMTVVGETALQLDAGAIRMTERALPYVSDARHAQPQPESTGKPRLPICDHCGANNENRAHICPRCKKPYCQHDDIKCSHRLNPVPTPAEIKNDEGKAVKEGVDLDGAIMIKEPKGMTMQWSIPTREPDTADN